MEGLLGLDCDEAVCPALRQGEHVRDHRRVGDVPVQSLRRDSGRRGDRSF
jgi:hypothetical protein